MRKVGQFERVRHLFENAPITLTANTLIPLIVMAMFWNRAPRHALAIWVAANFGLFLLRWLLMARWRKHGKHRRSPSFWGWMFTAGALCSGVLWGMMPMLLLDVGDSFNVLAIMLIMYGMVAGSITSNSAFYPAYAAFAVPAGGMLCVRLGMEGGDYLYLTGLLVVFLLVNLSFGWNHRNMVAENIRQRLLNEQLLEVVDRKRTQAEKASQDKSRFLAAVSHDLRQPLHALDLFHSSLSEQLAGGEEARLLGMAMQSGHALSEMLGELMDIARLDAGRVAVSGTVAPLAGLLGECVEEQRPAASEKGLSLRYVPPRKGCIRTDPVLFKRIVRNLIANAIRHTESGGVLVGARLRDGVARVEVYDTGPGIAEGERGRIFDEFYQVNNPERDREKGLGLGLAIVRRIAAMLGHEIEVVSRPGRGSRFSVIAPLCAAADGCEADAPDAAVDADLAGLFVVVVDDDRMILEGMRGLLRGWGCEVLLAEGEEELMAEMAAHAYPKPDMLVSDYRLRGARTGLDVVAAVRARFADAALPAAIISGDMQPEARQAAEAAGCAWLGKPVSGAEMRRLLATVAA